MNRVVQNTRPEQRLQRTPIYDVAGAFEEFVDVQFRPGILKDAHRPVLVEIHEHIDVAFRASFASCHRTEYCCMRDSKPPQVRLVRPECVENVLEIRSHGPSRVYQTGTSVGAADATFHKEALGG
jgi:hypothetical protein